MKKKHDGDSIDKLKKLLDDKEKTRSFLDLFYIKNTDEILKNARESIMKEHKKNAERSIKEIEKFNKMTNDNPDMLSKKKGNNK